ncbi:MAG TPA: response regulator [Steroidobacteraceae bacterium]|nr:response regulator [Steroidobacteraceae bacterium]
MTNASRAVLVIEDDMEIRRVLPTALELEQYRVIEAESGERGITELKSHRPDVVLLDLGLPDCDGVELIRRAREWSTVPIVVLSARTQEEQKVNALEAGADDYVTKPFGTRELLARMRVALRHGLQPPGEEPTFKIGQWRIDIAKRLVANDAGDQIHLTPLEYRLLEILSKHAGMVVTHRQLLQQVWGPGSVEQTHYIRGYIKQLRDKLEPDPAQPQHLLTETGVGYRLVIE